jgi:hypothetical protein
MLPSFHQESGNNAFVPQKIKTKQRTNKTNEQHTELGEDSPGGGLRGLHRKQAKGAASQQRLANKQHSCRFSSRH